MEDRTIIITTDDGKELICDILFTFFSDEWNKNFVVFQPRGEERVSAAIFEEGQNGEGNLTAIESEEEWEFVEELLNDYYDNLEEKCGGNCDGCSGCGGDCNGE